MAGGPNAAVVMCLHCAGKAGRVSEGLEADWYLCDECGRRFGIDWSRGQPRVPCWPPPRGQQEQLCRALVDQRPEEGPTRSSSGQIQQAAHSRGPEEAAVSAATLRAVPRQIPRLDGLGMPKAMAEIIPRRTGGLALVGGASAVWPFHDGRGHPGRRLGA